MPQFNVDVNNQKMTDNEVRDLATKLAFSIPGITFPNFTVWFNDGQGARGGNFRRNGRNGYGILYGRKGNGWFPDGVPTIVHEVAHAVDYLKGGGNRQDRKRPHGSQTFFPILLELIKTVYDDPSQYPWEREYSVIYNEAKRRGLTFKTWRDIAANPVAAINKEARRPFVAICPSCKHAHRRSRPLKPGRRSSCAKCDRRFNPTFELHYKRESL